MRRLSLADAPFLAIVAPSGPAPFVYNGVHVAASGTANSVTTAPIDTTGADLLVFSASFFFSNGITVSDNKGNTWTSIQTSGGGGLYSCFVWMSAAPIVGAGHTFTFTGVGDFASIAILGFTGAGATNPASSPNTTGAGVSSVQPGAILPLTGNQLFVTSIAFFPNNTMGIDSGFVITDEIPYTPGVNIGIATGYKLQTIAASENPTWSWTGSNTLAVSMVTLKR